MTSKLPSNVHVSNQPCLQVKLSQLRSASTSPKETKALVHEIAIILGIEALASTLKAADVGHDKSALGIEYITQSITPSKIALIPILRSGLTMVDALQLVLPHVVPVHHLGFFREPITLSPVEYYNNLPFQASSQSLEISAIADVAIILDPVIATGGTAAAAMQSLKEWDVKKVVIIAILGTVEGVTKLSKEWDSGVEIFVGAIDKKYNEKGMVVPGTGDLGDRIWLTIGRH